MAFSATVYNTQYLGPSKTKLSGSWTGASGDTAGSLAVGGLVTQANFYSFNSGNTWQIIPRVTVSVASGISTLTINNQDDVTTGYFEIEKMG
jgi:hypothetical protein